MDGTRMKRRGILAAAGAVVAGLAAKAASVPVAATSGTGTDGYLVLGSHGPQNSPNYALTPTVVVPSFDISTNPITGFKGQELFECTASPFSGYGDANVVGISGTSRGTAAGVFGCDHPGYKPSGYPANMNAGVYGQSYDAGHNGVVGDGGSFGGGVYGTAFNGVGVYGVSAYNYGVFGTAYGSQTNTKAGVYGVGHNVGVEGNIPANVTVSNAVAVRGQNDSTAAGAIGVQGQAHGIGVYGLSDTSYGILGVSSAGGAYSGVTGSVYTPTGAAFAGGASQASAYAAYFTGKVNIDGPLYVNGTQRFTLKHSDGSRRLVAGIQSPDTWIEDVGKGQLANGAATVTLDADYRELADTGDYHVFLTEYGDSGGLYIANQTATGFTVRARGTSSGTFSYRVMAKPRDGGGKVARLAKYDSPQIKIPGINGEPMPPEIIAPPPTPEKPKDAAPPAPAPAPSPRRAPETAAPSGPAPAAAQPTAVQPTAAQPTAAPAPAPPPRP